MSWRYTLLKDIASNDKYACVGGPFGSKLTGKDYVADGIPVIRGTNMGKRFISQDNFVYVTESKVDRDLFGNLAHPGDVVFTQRGTLGQVSIVPENNKFELYVVSQSQMKLTVDESRADAKFIYYFFSSEETVKKIMSYTSSSGVPHINLTVLRNFEIPLPYLEQQKEISRILSSYDDLIENNKRRIELLEESAQQLYKEWFVRFRFPGHEHVKIVGGVPCDWQKETLGDTLTLQRGFDLPLKNRIHGSVPIFASTGINGYHNESKVKAPGLVTGRSGSLGQVQFVHNDFWPLNTTLWVKEFKIVDPYFAYFLLISLKLENYNGGAAVPTLNRNDAHRIEVLLPTKSLLAQFSEQVGAIFKQTYKLDKINRKLSEARDLLLPKLMSGEIAV